MKHLVKKLLTSFGYSIVSAKHPFIDQRRLIGHDKAVILDIGANQGQSIIRYNQFFNNCIIYSFEPFPEAYKLLGETARNYRHVETINKAVGNTVGEVSFHINKFSPTNSILPPLQEASNIWENIMGATAFDVKGTIKVNSTTVDSFIEEKGIERIDILKIDTQGSEYCIIEGAAKTIEMEKIQLVYLEVLPLPTYKNQKYFDEILKLMRLCGFSLYNMYDFSYTKFGELRQLDALFLSSKIKKSIHP